MGQRVIVASLLVVLLGAVGCAAKPSAPPPPKASDVRRVETAQQIADRVNLHLTGQSESTEATVPTTLKGLPWELIQSVAVQGGYDLRPFVGQPVMLVKRDVVEKSDGHRQRLVTIEIGSRVVGAYFAMDDVVPGISGVGNPSN